MSNSIFCQLNTSLSLFLSLSYLIEITSLVERLRNERKSTIYLYPPGMSLLHQAIVMILACKVMKSNCREFSCLYPIYSLSN